MPNILILDDDEELLNLLSRYLREQGFSCVTAPDPETGLAVLRKGGIDALILDVMLPGADGFEVLRGLRGEESASALPVLMLTARGEEIDRIVGLEMGADDYLGKPFNPRELAARLRALLRRSGRDGTEPAAVRHIQDLAIHSAALCVTVNGIRQDLTVAELRLLNHLADHAGSVVSRDFLCREIFGHAVYSMGRSLDVLVSRLRRKLGPGPDGRDRIKAVRGEGYMLLLPGEQP